MWKQICQRVAEMKWNEMKKSHIKLKWEPQAIDIRNELWATGFLINKREDERAEVKIYR